MRRYLKIALALWQLVAVLWFAVAMVSVLGDDPSARSILWMTPIWFEVAATVTVLWQMMREVIVPGLRRIALDIRQGEEPS